MQCWMTATWTCVTSRRGHCRGFQLLAKMGYKPGQGIGAGGGGRVAPLEVDLKATRAGLGIDEAKKRQRDTSRAHQAERGAPAVRSQRAV